MKIDLFSDMQFGFNPNIIISNCVTSARTCFFLSRYTFTLVRIRDDDNNIVFTQRHHLGEQYNILL